VAGILVVDDEKDVVTLIRFVLEKDGHTVFAAHNGQEALDLLGVNPGTTASAKPDAIVLDIMMPVMDGYTVNTKLQAHPKLRDVPVIILTAKGTMRDLFEMAPNVAAYVEKPFEPEHLKQVLRGVLAKKAA
jgi:CheY-like chemotaxis protein